MQHMTIQMAKEWVPKPQILTEGGGLARQNADFISEDIFWL